MARHTLTYAANLFAGNAYYERYQNGKQGAPLSQLVYASVIPDTASVNGVLDGVTVETDETLTYTAGDMDLATLDVPRNIVIDTTDGQGSVDNVVTITGTDVYGDTLVEALTIADTAGVAGKKAFKTLTSISVAAGSEAATMDVGWGNVLGIPFYIDSKARILSPQADGSVEDWTVVVGDTDQDSTAGDCRGTFVPATTPNDVVEFSMLIALVGNDTKANVFGVDQYAG